MRASSRTRYSLVATLFDRRGRKLSSAVVRAVSDRLVYVTLVTNGHKLELRRVGDITEIRSGSTWRRATPGLTVDAETRTLSLLLRHMTSVLLKPSSAPGSVCRAEGLTNARNVFGTANPTESYRVRVAVDFDAHQEVTRILIRGLRYSTMTGISERIVYTR